MRAMLLSRIASLDEFDAPLDLTDLPVPEPADDEVLIAVAACGVCHTEFDEIEGRVPPPRLPVLAALANLRPGGRLVINAIRKETKDVGVMAAIRYEEHLWREKEIKTVANVTARDIADSLELAASFDLTPEVEVFPLEAANEALRALKSGGLRGAKVLRIATPAAPGMR